MRISRLQDPERVFAHIGPTNSGKTFDSLQRLKQHGKGVYAAPLRLLAREAFEDMSKELGTQVGLLTGEESINPEAPILCCTTEMAPMTGDILVLDEVHWLADQDRGQAWTKALLGAWKELHLIGSSDILPLLKVAFADLEIIWHNRLSPLTWKGKIDYKNLPSGTAVVAFSRKNVLSLGKDLVEIYGVDRVGVLYGAMPIESRRTIVEQFRKQKKDILVCTDVIGHGLNLPIQSIVMAETSKYDGKSLRELQAWEIAQIIGRAGRYGYHQEGEVYVLSGHEKFEPDPNLIKNAMTPRREIDGVKVYRNIQRASIRPNMKDLNVLSATKLLKSLEEWQKEANTNLTQNHPWLLPQDVETMKNRLTLLRKAGVLKQLSLQDAWTMANAPADYDDQMEAGLLVAVGEQLIHKTNIEIHKPKHIHNLSLSDSEAAARTISFLKWFDNTFPQDSPFKYNELKETEQLLARRVTKLVNNLLAGRETEQKQKGNRYQRRKKQFSKSPNKRNKS